MRHQCEVEAEKTRKDLSHENVRQDMQIVPVNPECKQKCEEFELYNSDLFQEAIGIFCVKSIPRICRIFSREKKLYFLSFFATKDMR